MTRLKTSDIREIATRLAKYDRTLKIQTGRSLTGIGCHAWGLDEARCNAQMQDFTIHVVPITAGLGVISRFSETVCAILTFMGFDAKVSTHTDTTGIAAAFESHAHAVMMSDDNRFVGINLNTRRVVDNSESTGRVFAAALDLMAGGLKDHPVLIMGCGPVGKAATQRMLELNALPALYDCDAMRAQRLKETLCREGNTPSTIAVEKDLMAALPNYRYIVEATPSANTIPEEQITPETMVATPGVPLGISPKGCQRLGKRLVHDCLELGVAAMAMQLVTP